MSVLDIPITAIEDTMEVDGNPEFWPQSAIVVREYQYFTDDDWLSPLDMTAGTVQMKVSADRGAGSNIATFSVGSGIEWINQAEGRFRIAASINYSGSVGFGLTGGGLVIGNLYSGNLSRAIALPFDIDYVVSGERYRLFYGNIPYLKGAV